MAVSVNDLASYLRLPPDSSEDLQPFIDAAKAEAQSAGVPDFQANPLYDQYIKEIAGEFYENRSMGISGAYPDVTVANIERMKNGMTLKLRYMKDGASDG